MYVFTAPSVAPSNFQVVNITSTSITFSWDTLVDGANGIVKLYVITCTAADDNSTITVSIATHMLLKLTLLMILD